MSYSFVLPGGEELSDIKLKITGKAPINPIEANVPLNDILKLNDGEEMSKVIIGKALKNNEELIKDEQKEIKFDKKYQILSKNTTLFAEMISEESQQNELITVDLTKIKAEEDKDDKDFDDFNDNDDDILQRRIIPVDDKV